MIFPARCISSSNRLAVCLTGDYYEHACFDCFHPDFLFQVLIIQLSEPETKSMDGSNQNMQNHISYLSNTQQDELMRRYILQERSFTPDTRCSECTNRSCKACQMICSLSGVPTYVSGHEID